MYLRLADSSIQMDLVVNDHGTARCLRWGAPLQASPAEMALAAGQALEHQYPGVLKRPDGSLASHSGALPSVPLVPGLDVFWPFAGGLQGHRGRDGWAPLFTVDQVLVDGQAVAGEYAEGASVEVVSTSADLRMAVRVRVEHGVLLVHAEVTNCGADDYALDSLSLCVPVDPGHDELLDFAGRWTLERQPQRRPFAVGQTRRESRWGRPGHENTYLMLAGERGFDFERGRVQGAHVAWAGNAQVFAELTVDGQRLLGGGELLLPGEVVLEPQDSYRTPDLLLAHGDGLDEWSSHVHDWVRARPGRVTSERPINYNAWEATQFEHTPEKHHALIEQAAAAGAERFVIDAGWFESLGDWRVSESVHPDGLEPLAEHVKRLGMKFGLWFEPEMMALASKTMAEHPDWLMITDHALIAQQHPDVVMNLAVPEAEEFAYQSMATLVRELGIDYLKWDHNRPLNSPGDHTTGRAVVHENVLAVQRIRRRLKEEFPGLEIEACAGGGGRIDLFTLEQTDRVWVSDSMDPVDRVGMQTWTSLLLPPELMGCHIGSEQTSISQRRNDLGYRASLCLFGHFGIEWDLTKVGETEMAELKAWSDFYREYRELVQHGRFVRRLRPDGVFLWGSVADDRALYLIGTTRSNLAASPAAMRLPGLDAGARYEVRAVWPGELPGRLIAAPWFETEDAGPFITSGELLTTMGLSLPVLRAEQTFLVETRRL